MNPEKVIINATSTDGKPVEVIIREGAAAEVLNPKAPIKIVLAGTIEAPREFLYQRGSRLNPGQFDIKRSHLIIDRENVKMTLVINENDGYQNGTIEGSLKTNPKMAEFGINTPKTWEPNELGQFLKMNRAFFESREHNMELVTKLKNFVANIDSKVEKQKSENGDFKDNFSGTVSSNLPGSFKLNIALFKGMPKESIDVEFMANVSARTITLQLCSPDAMAAFEDIRDKIIDEQIEKIRELEPGLLIIEK